MFKCFIVLVLPIIGSKLPIKPSRHPNRRQNSLRKLQWSSIKKQLQFQNWFGLKFSQISSLPGIPIEATIHHQRLSNMKNHTRILQELLPYLLRHLLYNNLFVFNFLYKKKQFLICSLVCVHTARRTVGQTVWQDRHCEGFLNISIIYSEYNKLNIQYY